MNIEFLNRIATNEFFIKPHHHHKHHNLISPDEIKGLNNKDYKKEGQISLFQQDCEGMFMLFLFSQNFLEQQSCG